MIAQLGERQTEDLKVPGSIPGLGISRRSTAARRENAAEEHRFACCTRLVHSGQSRFPQMIQVGRPHVP